MADEKDLVEEALHSSKKRRVKPLRRADAEHPQPAEPKPVPPRKPLLRRLGRRPKPEP